MSKGLFPSILSFQLLSTSSSYLSSILGLLFNSLLTILRFFRIRFGTFETWLANLKCFLISAVFFIIASLLLCLDEISKAFIIEFFELTSWKFWKVF
ncbi:hypothetical protein BpHYR1_047575 [Brachionus plicatilis]|uniref:Uncharacterized protein n=1 Tax=Brachionus plicatilis TaxID=10195 RepID=A0A3M7SS94_BRAPC|nr:hypothetical protein BpHYR1_047575 [Brachionus plicatilis]